MQETIVSEARLLKTDTDVARLLVKKTLSGTKFYVVSPEFHKFFFALRTETESIKVARKWNNMKYFNIAPGNIPILPEVTFDKAGEALIFPDGSVNLSFLRASDLDKGVEFEIPGLMQSSTLLSFKRAFADKVNTFYAEFLKPEEAEIQITTRRIERF